jgi:hypothetical protein
VCWYLRQNGNAWQGKSVKTLEAAAPIVSDLSSLSEKT